MAGQVVQGEDALEAAVPVEDEHPANSHARMWAGIVPTIKQWWGQELLGDV